MEDTILLINELIKNKVDALKVDLNGVAEPIVAFDESKEITIPAIVTSGGEAIRALYDSDYDLYSYHRFFKKDYFIDRKNGIGDEPKRYAVYNMALLVYGERKKISPLECEKICVNAIHQVSNNTAYTEVNTSTFDRLQVFNSEFQGTEFPLPPNIFLLKINYKLTRGETPCQNM